MKVLTVNIILKDARKSHPDIEMDGISMSFKEEDIDKAYELFKRFRWIIYQKKHKRDYKDC